MLAESWDAEPAVLAVRRPDRRLLGWIERRTNDTGWLAFIDGRAVVDAADLVPWVAQDADHAVTMLVVAADQRVA
ncbi:hypothetical protein [Kitasatospora sp. NPDC057936]|uniref:hypothetical protein n=1 Tax=Kitasatospora sp. NPDC057936 TaxID=3346283 RepID=UPI0036DC2494